MYQIVELSPEAIKKVRITNQEKIRYLTGSELDLLKAFELIKAESKAFTEENEKAMEADKLLFELLKKNNIEGSDKSQQRKKSNEKDAYLRLRERERLRMLALLELELQLSSES